MSNSNTKPYTDICKEKLIEAYKENNELTRDGLIIQANILLKKEYENGDELTKKKFAHKIKNLGKEKYYPLLSKSSGYDMLKKMTESTEDGGFKILDTVYEEEFNRTIFNFSKLTNRTYIAINYEYFIFIEMDPILGKLLLDTLFKHPKLKNLFITATFTINGVILYSTSENSNKFTEYFNKIFTNDL